jgi:hypothetical protein
MAGDAYFSAVSLLLHCDGVNGSVYVADHSTLARQVTVSGNAQISTAQSKFGGSSLYFDGTGDYVSVAHHASLVMGSDDFTMELWVRPSALSATAMLINKANATNAPYQTQIYLLATGAVVARSYDASSIELYSITSAAGAAEVGSWTHIALCRSGSTLSLYVNGVPAGTDTYVGALPDTGFTLSIGAYSSGTFGLNGYIDELRITKGVARYTTNFTPAAEAFANGVAVITGKVRDAEGLPSSRLVRAYNRTTGAMVNQAYSGLDGDPYYNYVSLLINGDGASGTTQVTDRSPNPKVITTYGNAQISTAQSKFGGSSLYFDGTGDYLSIPTDTAFDVGNLDFTMEAWVYTLTVSGLHAIWGYANGSASNTNYAYQMLQNNGSGWYHQLVVGGTQYGPSTAGGSVTANQWIHVAFVRSGTNLLSFINGTLVATTSVGAVVANNPAGSVLHIGQVHGFYPWNGYMEDLRFTRGIARYTTSFTPPVTAHPTYGGNATLGEFSMSVPSLDHHYVVALDDTPGTQYNALIVDRVIPT